MSRSYKKSPVVTDASTHHRYHPRPKAIANRIVRHKANRQLKLKLDTDDLDNLVVSTNNTYRREYSSYDIVDYRSDLRAYDDIEITDEAIRFHTRK